MIRHIFSIIIYLVLLPLYSAAQSDRPNFVVIVVDDAALMDFGVYGGEASTPHIDSLAANGMLFKQHRATPFCAPSRAMLMTGLDNHLAGFGTIPEVLPPEHRGQPGYMMALEPGVETIATKLKRAGYRTYTTGKWHLGHGPGELPDSHGFDRSFVLDASGADSWEDKPYLPLYKEAPWFEDGEPADLPADFYSSTFIADTMQAYLEADQDSPDPFFAYLSFMRTIFQSRHRANILRNTLIPMRAVGMTYAKIGGNAHKRWVSCAMGHRLLTSPKRSRVGSR